MSSGALITLPKGPADWACVRLQLDQDGSFVSRFEADGGADWIVVRVVPHDAPGRVFARLERCAVRYKGQIRTLTPVRREEVGAIVVGVGRSIDARMIDTGAETIAEALSMGGAKGTLVFSRDGLRALLAPEIVEGVEFLDGWRMVDVFPSSQLRDEATDALELVLDFQRSGDRRRALVLVKARAEGDSAFARSAHFSLSYLTMGTEAPAGVDTLCSYLGFLFQLRDQGALEVEFPDVSADLAVALLPAAGEGSGEAAPDPQGRSLNLAINTDCAQECAFCSVHELSAPTPETDALFARLAGDLKSNFEAGVRHLRLNGYDPLTYSRVVEITSLATALGYQKVDVFSPCTRLADRAFCEALVSSLPAQRTFHVPLYATEAALHDKIVGRPGAFDLVMQALDNLKTLVTGEGQLRILSVVVEDNVEALADLATFAHSRGMAFSAHHPYPSVESKADRYFSSAASQEAVAEALARSYAADPHLDRLFVHGQAPCVSYPVMEAAQVPLLRWLELPEQVALLPGTEYRAETIRHRASQNSHSAFTAASIPCPHVDACVLREGCTGELLRAYVERFGAEAFRPVSLRGLLKGNAGAGRR